MRKIIVLCGNLLIFAKICKFLRKFTDLCKYADFAKICNFFLNEYLQVFAKSRKMARRLDRGIFGFLRKRERKRNAVIWGFLNLCEKPQEGTHILRAAFS